MVSKADPMVNEEDPLVSKVGTMVNEEAPMISKVGTMVNEEAPLVSKADPMVSEPLQGEGDIRFISDLRDIFLLTPLVLMLY